MLIDIGIAVYSMILAVLVKQKIDSWIEKISSSIAEDEEDTPTVLELGATTTNFFNHPIKLNMRIFPSLAISGVSGSGKTYMLRHIVESTEMDVVILNAFTDDFKGLNVETIISMSDIIKTLTDANNGNLQPNTLLIIDETLSLMCNKEANRLLGLLLTKNRHFGIYVICVFQELQKTEVKFKSLFTTRCSFRALQQSDYQSNLGISIPDIQLNNREFILVSDKIYRGKTYSK